MGENLFYLRNKIKMNWRKILAGIGVIGSGLLSEGNVNAQEDEDRYNIQFKTEDGDEIETGDHVDSREVSIQSGKYIVEAPGQIVYAAALNNADDYSELAGSRLVGESIVSVSDAAILEPLLKDEPVTLDLAKGHYFLTLKYIENISGNQSYDTDELEIIVNDKVDLSSEGEGEDSLGVNDETENTPKDVSEGGDVIEQGDVNLEQNAYENDYRIKLFKKDDSKLEDLVTKISNDSGRVKVKPGEYVLNAGGQFVIRAELDKYLERDSTWKKVVDDRKLNSGEVTRFIPEGPNFGEMILNDGDVSLNLGAGLYTIMLNYAINGSSLDGVDYDLLKIEVEDVSEGGDVIEQGEGSLGVNDKTETTQEDVSEGATVTEQDETRTDEIEEELHFSDLEFGGVVKWGGIAPSIMGLIYDKNTFGRKGAVRGAIGKGLKIPTDMIGLKGYLFGQINGAGGLNTEDSLNKEYLPVGATLNERLSGEIGLGVVVPFKLNKRQDGNFGFYISGITGDIESDTRIGNLKIQKEEVIRGHNRGMDVEFKFNDLKLHFAPELIDSFDLKFIGSFDFTSFSIDQRTYLINKEGTTIYKNSQKDLLNSNRFLGTAIEFDNLDIGLGTNRYLRDLVVSGDEPKEIKGYNFQLTGGYSLLDDNGTIDGILVVPFPNQEIAKGGLFVRYSKPIKDRTNWFAQCGVSSTEYDTGRNVHNDVEVNCGVGISTGEKGLEDRLKFK